MKKVFYLFLIIIALGLFQFTDAQHKIAITFYVQSNNVGQISVYSDTINEGQVYTIQSKTLPSNYSNAATIYNSLAGSEFYFQSGSLNQDISLWFVISNINLNNGIYDPINGVNLFFDVDFYVYDWSGQILQQEPFKLNAGTYAVVKIAKSSTFNTLLNSAGLNLSTTLKFAYAVAAGFDTTGIQTFDSTNSVTAWISHFSNIIGSSSGSITAVKENANNLPTQFALKQNYPNPFNPSTNIIYDVPKSSFIQLNVYNILGQKVATLVNSINNAGVHNVTFNPGNLSSGLYIYQLKAGDVTLSRKMLFLK